MQAQAKMASAMGSTAKVMAATNKQMKLEDIQKTMANFDKESTKMDLAGEMSKWNLCHDCCNIDIMATYHSTYHASHLISCYANILPQTYFKARRKGIIWVESIATSNQFCCFPILTH